MTRVGAALALLALLDASGTVAGLPASSAQETVAPADRAPDAAAGDEDPADGTGAGEAATRAVPLTLEQEARARAIEGELRCPVCRSQSIRQSRSFMAEDMKRRIRELVAEGRTDDEIRGYFVERYGEWVLLTPPRRGFNLAAYLLPILAVAAGAVGLVLVARRWSRRGGAPTAEPPLASPYLARLEREIEETE